MRLTHMRFQAWARHAAAPVLVMALVMTACGGGAAGGGPEDTATADPDPLATISPLDPAIGGGDASADPDPSDDPGTETTEPPNDDEPIGEEEQVGTPAIESSDPHVAVAVADLASRMDVAAGDVMLILQEEVMWRDGSLGCPQPGFSYTQALVDGYKITLEVNGVTYAYHGRAGQDPFLCENDLAADKSGGPITLEPKEEGGSDDLNYDGSLDD